MEASLDRIRAWEETTGGFLSIGPRESSGGSSTDGVPF